MKLFYIWRHSFEFDKNDKDRWNNISNICKELSGCDETWYATNGEICEHILSFKKLAKDGDYLVNNSEFSIYLEASGDTSIIKPKEKICTKEISVVIFE